MRQAVRCQYRGSIESDGGLETARCGILQEIVGIDDTRRFRVGRDACEACCQSVLPARDRINQVLASFLYAVTDEIIAQGGARGCDLEKAHDLHRWAENHLEVYLPDQPDLAIGKRTFQRCCHLGKAAGHRIQATSRGHVRVPVFHCVHPLHGETTEEDCNLCRDWASSPSSPRFSLHEALGPPKQGGSRTVRRWAVGVTTAPRRGPTLETCLDYLARAGWTDPRLFVDEGVSVSERFALLPVTLRRPSIGAWPNYYLALLELLSRHPDADVVMIVQDDACFYDRENLRAYLEQSLWPSEPPGIVSLYCSSAYTRAEPGWHAMEDVWNWGALAFVFPRARALQFVTDPEVVRHRWTTGGLKLVDEVVGKWALRAGVPIHYPTPSLVQHLGTTSTLWPGVPSAGFRRADAFAGDP